MKHLAQCQAWQDLQQHYQEIRDIHMREWFASDSQRFHSFSLEAAGLLLDFSKNRITGHTLKLLVKLAEDKQLSEAIERLMTGHKVNGSESRAALHTALRNRSEQPIYVDGQDVMPAIRATLTKMAEWSERIRNGQWCGSSGLPIETVINVGIGGSDLGPALVYDALSATTKKKIPCYFLSCFDSKVLQKTLQNLNPATTIVIFASKSFTTQETLANAQYLKNWFLSALNDEAAVQQHFFAVTAQPEKAIAQGILPDHIFPFWEWVGGRFSLWSSVGLSIAIALGMKTFYELLEGAYEMDCHFRSASLINNMPVILALLEVWYRNFFAVATRAIIPYETSLRLLLDYLQQAHMESLGKSVDVDGKPVEHSTGLIIWGGVGTNSQHSFHQLLMQGKNLVPVDFILPLAFPDYDDPGSQQNCIANCLAQSQTLMEGYAENQVADYLNFLRILPQQFSLELPHRVIPGNSPSNTLVLPALTPKCLGALLALYEHKIFVCSVLWGINAFDQWGVERGKHLAKQLEQNLQFQIDGLTSQSSLIDWISNRKRLEVV